jgi:hypothetical protein
MKLPRRWRGWGERRWAPQSENENENEVEVEVEVERKEIRLKRVKLGCYRERSKNIYLERSRLKDKA